MKDREWRERVRGVLVEERSKDRTEYEREGVCVESESGEKAAQSTGPSPCAGGVRFLEKRTSELSARVSTRGRADGTHVADEAREMPAASREPTRKGKSRLPFLFLLIWGLCVSAVGGLVCYVALFKCADCRVFGCNSFSCIVLAVN